MNAHLLASNLGFPEGPVVMPDGRIVFCDGNVGELLVWDGSDVQAFADVGGSPWGAVLGSDLTVASGSRTRARSRTTASTCARPDGCSRSTATTAR